MTSISLQEDHFSHRVQRALDLDGGVVRVRPENRLRAAGRWVAAHTPTLRPFRKLEHDLDQVIADLEAYNAARAAITAQLAEVLAATERMGADPGQCERIEAKIEQATALL